MKTKRLKKTFFELNQRGYLKILPDRLFLKIEFRIRTGRPLRLKDPQTFNEKLQWLKLYDRKPIYTTMVDKYAAKQYVAERIGEEHIIPTLGVWDRFDDIDFDALPDQFVLKCTHDSGGLVICHDKSRLDRDAARQKIEKCLRRNYYWHGREWPYKNVKPRILAESYMKDGERYDLRDYKFYCFDGVPRFLYLSEGLENHKTASISFLTCDWQFAPYGRSDFKPFESLPPKPEKLDEMLSLAAKLSAGFPFLRVDLYQINGKVYFSELTFSPCGGFMPFRDSSHDAEIGKMLRLPKKEKARHHGETA